MRALVYRAGEGPVLVERPGPRLTGPDDVLVRVLVSGICGTDRNICLGKLPAMEDVVLGHEAVGVVQETGAGAGAADLVRGDVVVLDPTLHCGFCTSCRFGRTNFCENKAGLDLGIDRDGTFAEFVVVPARFLHRLPRGYDIRSAVLIEPLACVLSNLLPVTITFDETVVVLGGGPVGLLCCLVAERCAARVVLVEADEYRARRAAALGISVEPLETLVEECKQYLGHRPRVIVDTTGMLLDVAVEIAAPGARIVMMGYSHTMNTISVMEVVTRGLKIAGAGGYCTEAFALAQDLAQRLDVGRLVTHELDLSDHRKAFALLGIGGTGHGYDGIKVLLRSGPDPKRWSDAAA